MPRKINAGTWEGHPAYRWTRMIRGTRWRLLCRGRKPDEREKKNTAYLDLPESKWTKQGSLQAANDWWDRLLSPDSHLSPELMAYAEERLQENEKLKRILQKAGIPQSPKTLPLSLEMLRVLDEIEEPTPPGKTVKHWSDNFLKHKLALSMSPGRVDNLRRSIDRFVDSVGGQNPVTSIDWNAWDDFLSQLRASKLSPSTKRDVASDVRQFVRWLERRELIPLVKNLSESQIKITATKIQHFSLDELREILLRAQGMLRCFLLLFCNCGFRQSDVATLTDAMIDNAYITRQRAKTQGSNAPTVRWRLWDETIEAINSCRSSGDLLFVRENGMPWVIEKLNEQNKRSRDDAFRRVLWLPFARENSIRLSSDSIRASCANLLMTSSSHTNQLSVQIKYLGQAPSGVALKHYIDPPQAELDSAILTLRKLLLE